MSIETLKFKNGVKLQKVASDDDPNNVHYVVNATRESLVQSVTSFADADALFEAWAANSASRASDFISTPS